MLLRCLSFLSSIVQPSHPVQSILYLQLENVSSVLISALYATQAHNRGPWPRTVTGRNEIATRIDEALSEVDRLFLKAFRLMRSWIPYTRRIKQYYEGRY